MEPLEILQLVVQILILLLLLYVAFLRSYFQEKGKNLATKEDVEEITSLVESVQLHFSLHAKLSLRAEEHESLMDYFSKYYSWLTALMNCSFAGIRDMDASRLEEIRTQLNGLQQDFRLAAGRMELLVQNEDILSQHGELMVETLKVQSHAEQKSFEFERSYLDVEHMKRCTPLDQQLEKHQDLLEKRRELYRIFKDEQVEMYAAVLPLVMSHRSTISRHLRDMAGR